MPIQVTKYRICKDCDGDGVIGPHWHRELCEECNGSGKFVAQIVENGVAKKACEGCDGAGETGPYWHRSICRVCQGRRFFPLDQCVSCLGTGYQRYPVYIAFSGPPLCSYCIGTGKSRD